MNRLAMPRDIVLWFRACLESHARRKLRVSPDRFALLLTGLHVSSGILTR